MNVQESELDLNIGIEAVYTIKQNINMFSACGSLFCVKQAETAPAFRNKGLTVKVWGGGERERERGRKEVEERVQWAKLSIKDLSLNPWYPGEARCSSVRLHCRGCYGAVEAETGQFSGPCQPAGLVMGVQL